jgi:hypothetical protein
LKLPLAEEASNRHQVLSRAYMTSRVLSNVRYRIVTSNGQVFTGASNAAGSARRVNTKAAASLKNSDEIPDSGVLRPANWVVDLNIKHVNHKTGESTFVSGPAEEDEREPAHVAKQRLSAGMTLLARLGFRSDRALFRHCLPGDR